MPLVLGCFAFLLFFLYDWNQLAGNRSVFRILFPAGCFLLVLSTGLLFWNRQKDFSLPLLGRIFAFFFCLLTGLLTLYSLFGALPFSSTYVAANNRKTFTHGVYALCRHPGVLFLAGFYGGLWLLSQDFSLIFPFFLLNFLNFCYAWFQDRITFPKQFDDYPLYQKSTPFLLPNRDSIKRCLSWYFSWKGGISQ